MTTPDPNQAKANEPSLAGLTAYPGNPFVISEVACQDCEQIRPGIKAYWVLYLIYPIFFVFLRHDTVVKCPSCMRRFLCERVWLALLLANFLSPIVFIWWAVLFVRTFLP